MKPVVTLQQADDDLESIVRYYQRVRPGYGKIFVARLREALLRVREYPEMYALWFENVRAAHVHGFPYKVHYRISPTEIELISVIDQRLDPSSIAEELSGRVTRQ